VAGICPAAIPQNKQSGTSTIIVARWQRPVPDASEGLARRRRGAGGGRDIDKNRIHARAPVPLAGRGIIPCITYHPSVDSRKPEVQPAHHPLKCRLHPS
jgi:hypothetical protein